MTTRPLILLDPHPRASTDIFDDETRRALDGLGEIVEHAGGPMPAALVEQHLPRASLLLGQTDLPAERLARAPNLRGVINVETNFLANIDYETCFSRGIHVLTPGSAFAPVVAEMALAMAIDLARGITGADRAMRAGDEAWGLAGNTGCFMFSGSAVGLVGYGDLGRALHRLLAPFGCRVRAFDPWLPDYFLRAQGVEPTSLDEVLAQSRTVFVFAGVSSENAGFIARPQFETMQPGSSFLLLSRAAVVDFPEMLRQARIGRLRVATDVFPSEPLAADDPARSTPNLLLSAHRAGALVEALHDIGRQAVADAGLILRGLAPVVCRRAQRETVGRSRSKPIEMS
ncbi:hydroxyacid dehydrogenase [Lichenicoccus roseus]|uniref:Hydroxyacid dehydrogenase n=1 Tax=Lichenicoccus roseus TaxID=2683649 RepID=A0A5R9J1R2_9PROT|nr:hydroxyacid dehydrogenase [Lichenicoccus roseus]TLU71492.1 hydroxyacid dehydrogenase [Lichenicoccus roseus]